MKPILTSYLLAYLFLTVAATDFGHSGGAADYGGCLSSPKVDTSLRTTLLQPELIDWVARGADVGDAAQIFHLDLQVVGLFQLVLITTATPYPSIVGAQGRRTMSPNRSTPLIHHNQLHHSRPGLGTRTVPLLDVVTGLLDVASLRYVAGQTSITPLASSLLSCGQVSQQLSSFVVSSILLMLLAMFSPPKTQVQLYFAVTLFLVHL